MDWKRIFEAARKMWAEFVAFIMITPAEEDRQREEEARQEALRVKEEAHRKALRVIRESPLTIVVNEGCYLEAKEESGIFIDRAERDFFMQVGHRIVQEEIKKLSIHRDIYSILNWEYANPRLVKTLQALKVTS